jgi:hypothetical protein
MLQHFAYTAHECLKGLNGLCRWQGAAVEALPDSLDLLWSGASTENPKAKDKSKDGQSVSNNKPKFGQKRLALILGKSVMREIICTLLESSSAG